MGRPKKEGEYIPLNVKLPKELVERLSFKSMKKNGRMLLFQENNFKKRTEIY